MPSKSYSFPKQNQTDRYLENIESFLENNNEDESHISG